MSKANVNHISVELDLSLFGIDGCLKRLERIATAILDATQASLHRRVRAFAEKNRDTPFEKVVWLTIVTRFPSVASDSDRQTMWAYLSQGTGPPGDTEAKSEQELEILKKSEMFSGLFRALFETTTFRHYRMLYERQRRLKDLEGPAPDQSIPTEEINKPKETEAKEAGGIRAVPSHINLTSRAAVRQASPQQPVNSETEPTLPYTVDLPRFKARMDTAGNSNSAETSDKKPYTASESGDVMYPRPPRLPKGATEGICHLCLQLCPADVLQGNDWV